MVRAETPLSTDAFILFEPPLSRPLAAPPQLNPRTFRYYGAPPSEGESGARSLFKGGSNLLTEIAVLVGVYGEGEEVPYTGGVLDMTSG